MYSSWNPPAGGLLRFSPHVVWWRMTLWDERIQPPHCPTAHSGRVGPQQQHCDRFNLWRLGFTIAIHPLNRLHFVEIYHCHCSEGTQSRWLGELCEQLCLIFAFTPRCPVLLLLCSGQQPFLIALSYIPIAVFTPFRKPSWNVTVGLSVLHSGVRLK